MVKLIMNIYLMAKPVMQKLITVKINIKNNYG